MEARTQQSHPQSQTHRRADVLSELSALRDTAKVRLHLLSLDARRAFSEVEGRLDALEQRIQSGGDRVADVALGKAAELARVVQRFLDGTIPEQPDHSVRWLMQDAVRTVGPHDSLNQVAAILWEQNCGVVPVVRDGRVVGMITDRDVCMAVYTQGQPAANIEVGSAMSRHVYSCQTSDTVFQALHVMGDRRVRRLPVLDSEGQLRGVISLSDIARYIKALNDDDAARALLDTLVSVTEREIAVDMAAQ